MKIQYYEDDDGLFIGFTKGEIARDESVEGNVSIGDTATGIAEITILDARKSGIYPLRIERVLADVACPQSQPRGLRFWRSGCHAPAWEQVVRLQRRVAGRAAGAAGLHPHAGAWGRE